MSWLSNIVSAVQNYFAPKPASSNVASWSQISKSLGNAPVNFSNVKPLGANVVSAGSPSVKPAPKSTPTPQVKGVSVQGPTYTPNRVGGGVQSGSQSGVPSNTSAPPPYVPPVGQKVLFPGTTSGQLGGIANTIANVAKNIVPVAAPLITSLQEHPGTVGKALTGFGTAIGAPQILPGGAGVEAQGWAGFQQAVEEAKKGSFLQQLPEIMSQYSKRAQGLQGPEQVWGVFGDILNRIRNPQQGTVAQPNLMQVLQSREAIPTPSTTPTGTLGRLPGISTSNVPSAAKGGAPRAQSKGLIPSPSPSSRGGMVPSAVNAATLPANMANLTSRNVNPALASAITPEAIQSIGQLLLQSLLGNQSGLTGLSPGIAQALWGAPTANMPFGGYDASAAVPDQERIRQPSNLPPIPGPIAQG